MQKQDNKCEYIGKSLGKIHRLSMMYFSKHFSKFNIGSGQCFLLVRIYNNPGITQEELAISMKLDKGTTARAIKKLEDNGYVQRIKRTDDKRAYSIMTTEKAESIKQEVYAIMDTWEEKLKSCFTTEEAKQFMKLLNKLESENLI